MNKKLLRKFPVKWLMIIIFSLLAAMINEVQADIVGALLNQWNAATSSPTLPVMDIHYRGFLSNEEIQTERGEAHVVRIQYGQVHLKAANDPFFLLVSNHALLVRVVVKSNQVEGLRAPPLRLVLDHAEKGRLFNSVLKAQGALPLEEEPTQHAYTSNNFFKSYIAVIPSQLIVRGRYRVWVAGGHPAQTYIPPYEENIDIQPTYHFPVTVMPFQLRDGAAPDMRNHTTQLYQSVFQRYFPFLQPYVRIRPFAVISAMNEADMDEGQLHMDGTTMMIADQARKNLYVGVYHKSKHDWVKGERVGASSGSLLVVQDQLIENELDVLGHEIGHSLGLKHSPCGNPELPIDKNFPYPNAAIGSSWGIDWLSQPGKITLIDPAKTKDIMSYCFQHRYISDYSYFYAHKYWRNYRAQNYLALLGDIYALQFFAYPPANQMEVHGIGDLIEGYGKDTKKSNYVFEITDHHANRHERLPAFIKTLPDGQQVFVARNSAIGWLKIDQVKLIDPTGSSIMESTPTLNYLNYQTPISVEWKHRGNWLTLSYDASKYNKGIVVYEAANHVRATLAFLDHTGRQNVSLKGLPKGGYFWLVLASSQKDKYGRRALMTIREPYTALMPKLSLPSQKN